jgi:hypothetical protein
MIKSDKPHLTIVGGQPPKVVPKNEVEVPIGLSKLLYLAARDEALKKALLDDRPGTVKRLGVRLRPSEASMLQLVSRDRLEEMIDRIRPENPRKRRFMGIVAAAATSLAAGTVDIGCGCESGGIGPDISVDGGPEAGADTDSTPDGGQESE